MNLPRTIRSFVRRTGRMTSAQLKALEQFWPQYGLESSKGQINWQECFGREQQRVLEIGFGMGHSLLHLAQHYPDIDFMGIEVHTPGVGHLLNEAAKLALKNIRVYKEDVITVLAQCIADTSLDAVLIFFPDPWPKKRHHKRRLIQTGFIERLRPKLKPGGILHIATDWANYAGHIQGVLKPNANFQPIMPAEFMLARPTTKFEQRGKKLGHGIWDLVYKRISP